jgi:hypothetical protein
MVVVGKVGVERGGQHSQRATDVAIIGPGITEPDLGRYVSVWALKM